MFVRETVSRETRFPVDFLLVPNYQWEMPEKTASQIPRPLREQYDKGVAAFERKNFDYALSILNGVLQQEPAFIDGRRALRATQFKKSAASTNVFRRFLGGASSYSQMLTRGQLALRKNPIEAIALAEEILNSDSNNPSAHKLLAEAALAADFPRTAILSLEIVVKNSPKDDDSLWKLAETYSRLGEVKKAQELFEQLGRLRPDDSLVAQALKDVSAQRTMAEGGYDALADGQGSYRDILRNKTEAVGMEQENRQVKDEEVVDRLIRDNEARLKNEPENLKLHRTLAELFAEKKQFDRALEYFNRIIAIEGAVDPSLEKLIADTTIRKYDFVLSELDPNLPEYEQQAERLRTERDQFLLAQAQQRADKYPNDLQMRFDLGQVYFRLSRFNEAIQEFQKAQNHPHLRTQAMRFLAQCFSQRGMNDLAARTLQNALKEKLIFDEEKKELLYQLGTVLDKMGKAEEAIEQFKMIYEVDIGYRDVASKVDDYYAGK